MSAARTVVLLLLFMALWLLWSGQFDLETGHFETVPLVFGVVSCVLVVWLGARMRVVDEEGYPLHLWLGLLGYLPWLLWQIAKSNWDVARIILSPSLPISPSLFYVNASQKTEIGRVIHANSITITPGTISLDLRDNRIMVHALTADAAAEDNTGEMDRRVSRMEGTA